MKPKFKLLPLLIALGASTTAHAADVTWDIAPGTVGAGNGTVTGGTGIWDTSTGNWTTDGGANNIAWNNLTNASDTAVFGGTAGTVTVDAGGITAGALNVTGAYSFTGGAITASGGLTKGGSGTMQILNNNAITGNIVITGGELQLGSNGNTGSLNGGSFAGDISIASGSTFRDRSNNTVTMSGVISGNGNLHKDGSGTMTLSGANTYTGKTIIAASGAGGPTLSVSSLNSVATNPVLGTVHTASSSLGAPTTVANGTIQLGSGTNTRSCTLLYTGAGETTDRVMDIRFNSGAKHTISNTGGGLLKFTSNFTITPSSGNTGGGLTLRGSGNGEIAQMGTIPGILEKADAGTWTIGGANKANSVKVSGGSLVIAGGASVSTAGGVTFSGGGTLNLNGSGTSSRAVLGGTGAFAGTLTLDNLGDTLAPGNSPGIMPFTVGQTWESFSYDWELNDWSASVAGTNFDQVSITGTLDLSAVSANSYLLNILSLDGTNATGDVFNFVESTNSWSILTTTGGISGFDAAEWNINAAGFTNSEGGSWSIGLGNSGNDLVLTYTAVPEPAAALLGGLGFLALLRRRRA